MSKFQQMKRKAATAQPSVIKPAISKSSLTGKSSSSIAANSTVIGSDNLLYEIDPIIFDKYPLTAINTKSAAHKWDITTANITTVSNTGIELFNSSGSSSSTGLSLRKSHLPPGYDSTITTNSNNNNDLTDSKSSSDSSIDPSKPTQSELIYSSAMALGISPGKQLLMTAFMLWMSGNSLHSIITISMLVMAFWQPLQKLLAVNTEFSRYNSSEVDIRLPKLVWILCNLAGIALALYKAQTMGLVPSSPADWLTQDVRPAMEYSTIGAVKL